MKKVFVGLSGGVDSAVSAGILKCEGYDVTGVFIKIWQPEWLECTWREDRLDAMRVAATLDISFKEIDLTEEYKKTVIDNMIAEYLAGRTPNPDVMCNRTIKFGAFKDWALGQGADFVATGHYVRIKENKLLVGIDANKDQSYFLWTLTQDDLSKIIFPVGGMTKLEVRNLAKKFGLPNSNKKDSQGLCFVGALDIKDFLSKYIETKPGNVLDKDDKIIGRHPGALFFTIGERRGFVIKHKTPHDKPYYVISKDMENNTIIVSNKIERAVLPERAQTVIKITNVNWIGYIPKTDKTIQVRNRYRQILQDARIEYFDENKKEALIKFEKSQEFVASGQSSVVYDGEICLGGGIIAML